jgi:hypothetical protein
MCAVTVLALAGLCAPAALAAGGNAIINDCQSTGRLTHNYTLKELQHALAVMPASVKQYTSCYDVITQGILTVKAGHETGPKGGGGGSFLPTWVIVILVVLVLAAVTFGAMAIRQRRSGPGDGAPPAPPPAGGSDDGTPTDAGGPEAGDGPPGDAD